MRDIEGRKEASKQGHVCNSHPLTGLGIWSGSILVLGCCCMGPPGGGTGFPPIGPPGLPGGCIIGFPPGPLGGGTIPDPLPIAGGGAIPICVCGGRPPPKPPGCGGPGCPPMEWGGGIIWPRPGCCCPESIGTCPELGGGGGWYMPEVGGGPCPEA